MHIPNRQLMIIRGVQGSGKSTLAGMLMEWATAPWEETSESWRHFEADMYFIDPTTKEYKFKPEELGQAHRWCEYNVNEAMKNGKNVIVSNTFVKRKEMQPYIEMAQQHGYTVQEIICRGRFKNTHGVPEEKVESKRQAFEY